MANYDTVELPVLSEDLSESILTERPRENRVLRAATFALLAVVGCVAMTLAWAKMRAGEPVYAETAAATRKYIDTHVDVDYTPLNFSTVKTNNLGGQGPADSDPEELRYGSVLPGVDLVVVSGQYYHAPPNDPDAGLGHRGVGNNGVYGNLGSLDVQAGTYCDLTYSFITSSGGEPVTLDAFNFTIWGITGAAFDGEKQIVIPQWRNVKYNVSSNTSINVGDHGLGMYSFGSTAIGTIGSVDYLPLDSSNPSPIALSQAVTLSLQDTSKFKIAYQVQLDPDYKETIKTGRMYLWSGLKIDLYRQIKSEHLKAMQYVLDWCWADGSGRAKPCTGEEDKNNVYVHTLNNENNQLWYYDHLQRLVVSMDKTKCLAVNTETDSNVLVEDCAENDHQKWSVSTMKSGENMEIKSLYSGSNGLCLDWCKDNTKTCSLGITNNVYVRKCNSEAWQSWQWA